MSKYVEMIDITKTFPGVRALSSVSLSAERGEIHAIVGENGAGKSTLMKILGGVHPADSGKIFIEGKQVTIKSVKDSIAAGISVIFQEFNLMNDLTVAENIFIDNLPKQKVTSMIRRKELNENTKALMERLNIDINPSEYVSNLSVSQKQMVEIAKALSYDSQIIIMDEPTATLTNKEVDKLYEIIHMLKKENKTILYISHRMKEIFDITDTVTVLRDGELVGTDKTENLDNDKIVKMMVGRDITNYYHAAKHEIGKTMLEIKSFTKEKYFNDINIHVKQGEILGIGGLMGSGREEFLKAIYGIFPHESGEIYIEGKRVKIKSPKDAMKHGIGFVTEDRKEGGIMTEMSVRENTSINVIKKLSGFLGYLDVKKEKELLDKYTKYLNMKYANESQKIMFLSGGNQQKVLLARALAAEPKILIMLEPTRGIDVGAKSEIYNLLNQLAENGISVIILSNELPELIAICSRVYVVFQGKITGELYSDEINEQNIMQCATGNRNIFSEVN